MPQKPSESVSVIDLDYPLDFSLYTIEEIEFLIDFLDRVEASKRRTPDKTALKEDYKKFRSIIRNKAEEKRIDKAFEKQTGVSIYRLMQSLEH